MMLERTDKGVVTVKYQDADNIVGTDLVRVILEGDGESVRVESHRVDQEDTTLHLSYHDSLALAAALTAAEVPPPPRKG